MALLSGSAKGKLTPYPTFGQNHRLFRRGAGIENLGHRGWSMTASASRSDSKRATTSRGSMPTLRTNIPLCALVAAGQSKAEIATRQSGAKSSAEFLRGPRVPAEARRAACWLPWNS
jgi:hypothetical protein